MRDNRGQNDGLQDEYSADAVINYTDPDNDPETRSRTRQEFKAEADINNILKKFGVDAFNNQPILGSMDYDTNLHEAMELLASANRLHRDLPEELRAKYPTRADIIEGLDSGQFITDLEAINNPPTPTPAPATPTP